MKRHYLIDSFVFLALIFTTICFVSMTKGQSTVSVQMDDSYFVVDKFRAIVLVIGPVTFVTFLLLGLTRRFKVITSNIGLVIGLLLIILIAIT